MKHCYLIMPKIFILQQITPQSFLCADEPDNILTCVGYWMEDMKSYLVTWDEEDAISAYRCWVRPGVDQ